MFGAYNLYFFFICYIKVIFIWDIYHPPIVCILFKEGFNEFDFIILIMPSGFFLIDSKIYSPISTSDFPCCNRFFKS